MYGCRIIAVVGSILSCVGLLISSFATSIYFMYFFYGCVGGNIITVQHFSKRRGLACGITLCGSDPHNCENISLTPNTGSVKTDKSVDENNFEMETEPEESAIKRDTGKREIYKSPDTVLLKQMFQSIFDTSLLTDLRFWIFLLSTVVVHLAFSVVITMTADRAMELGMTKYEASWLASSIGIANTASRICLGWLADQRFMSRIVMASLLLLLAGVSTALSHLLRTFSTRIVGTSFYGFCIGGYIAICPLILADMFSSELIAKSLGLYLFCTWPFYSSINSYRRIPIRQDREL
ncbi:monocarboxylate transporter 12-like isoform X2 [Mercenaria mercenaria]|uniref:monocarboxylate transporter 12-like isoform X2 n=1 Tax=Mercenaria mercenaria TaxID=6596 RepID=UPI00234F5707|nr:monocarboxylate transporter 12-like isoform X2 [Mercenaria mercenaria]